MEVVKYLTEFTFQSFWHFLGIWILLAVFANGVLGMFRTTIIYKNKEDKDE